MIHTTENLQLVIVILTIIRHYFVLYWYHVLIDDYKDDNYLLYDVIGIEW